MAFEFDENEHPSNDQRVGQLKSKSFTHLEFLLVSKVQFAVLNRQCSRE